MKNISFPRNSFKIAGRVALLVVAGFLIVITQIKDKNLLIKIVDITHIVINFLATISLYVAARRTSIAGNKSSISWYYWMTASLSYLIGSIIWAINELILGIPPIPSFATVFYVLFYILAVVGLTQYTPLEVGKRVKKLDNLDNVIVILGVWICFWIGIFWPAISANGFNISTLMDVIIPGLGMFTVWFMMVFFRTRIGQSSYIPLLMIGFGIFSELLADGYLISRYVNNTTIKVHWENLGYILFSISFLLAGIRHTETLSGKFALTRSFNQQEVQIPFTKSWPAYLPYIWLATAIVLLIYTLPPGSDLIPIIILIGIIICLVILRLILTIIDNEKLFQKARNELAERELAEAELYEINLELDNRVNERTKELHKANNLLIEYNQQIKESLRDKEILMKETYHRVKNNMQVVSSLINLQSQVVEDPRAKSALKDSQMRLNSMALIHEKLYQSENLSEIGFAPYIKNLSKNLFNSYLRDNGRINLEIDVDEFSVGAEHAVPVGLILNELISNSLKYAFPDNKSGNIKISLKRESNERVILGFHDTGIGLPDDFRLQTSKSLGMRLIYNLAKQLNADVKFNNHPGVNFEFGFPFLTEDNTPSDPNQKLNLGRKI